VHKGVDLTDPYSFGTLGPGSQPGLFHFEAMKTQKFTLRAAINRKEMMELEAHPPVFHLNDQPVISLSGNEAADLLHRISTNQILVSQPGKTMGTCFLNEKGRLVDFVTVIHHEQNGFLLLPSTGNKSGFLQWIDRFIIMEQLEALDCSAEWVVCQAGSEFVRQLTGTTSLPGQAEHITVRTSGVEAIISANPLWPGQWIILWKRGGGDSPRLPEDSGFSLTEPGPVLDLLRIWNGVPMFGKEIQGSFNPYDTNLDRFIHSNKGCYVGQEVIARLATYDKIRNRLAGVFLSGEIPELPAEIVSGNTPAGFITSTAPYVIEGRIPALAVVNRKMVADRHPVSFLVGARQTQGHIVDLPFSTDGL